MIMRDETEEREIPAQVGTDSLFLVHELYITLQLYIVKVVGALLAKKTVESQCLNVTCIMENKEILMQRASLRAE